jgi:hypothetical protein
MGRWISGRELVMSDSDKRNSLERYEAAMHAMQTGVAFDQAAGSQDGSPKHLRVGINLAMSDHASLVRLLLAKGIITEEEYFQAVAEGMEQEAEEYRKALSERWGKDVKLY